MAKSSDKLSIDFSLPAVTRPTWFGKSTRTSITDAEIAVAAAVIKEDPSHEKNGWTPEALAVYFKERRVAQSDTVLHRRPIKPKRTDGWHNPHRWRR